jgi:hypothetical protein
MTTKEERQAQAHAIREVAARLSVYGKVTRNLVPLQHRANTIAWLREEAVRAEIGAFDVPLRESSDPKEEK